LLSPIPLKPDLVVTNVSATSALNLISFTVRNVGPVSSGECKAELFINGVSKSTINIPALNSDASVVKTFPWVFAIHTTYTIEVKVDSANTISESDETNNSLKLVFSNP
jgi:subtilase family serine protease